MNNNNEKIFFLCRTVFGLLPKVYCEKESFCIARLRLYCSLRENCIARVALYCNREGWVGKFCIAIH